MELLLRLLIAHLIGDFLLQPKNWVQSKEKKKLRSKKLYLHVIIHVALSFILLWNTEQWYIPLIIGISHFIIDGAKVIIQRKKTKRLLFFIDQLLHLAVIMSMVLITSTVQFNFKLSNEFLFLIASIIFLTMPSSIMIKMLISVYTPKTEMKHNGSLQNAGMYIGMLERLLVFVFIATNHWEGVGFLIAAKSIFRFNDLTQSKDRKLTEYILIGTLLSFGVAILTGICFQYIH
ncbi:Protein of unknown function [Zhouia amylolytica]|uniref:DUF3307 domain-containing protein n=1 Tax=Zhouia amylolytica TaxID=376730 RepID=A0A1I6QJC3_9FLAO|nr:DUF3307 domain-containing protein [Zhouia amylolytica]MCQ0111244.1 DUF3307 domain-containing protein [Zhouia amylolytica]SFS52388.1 Protein of unknown function [Zhouia amylolytica]